MATYANVLDEVLDITNREFFASLSTFVTKRNTNVFVDHASSTAHCSLIHPYNPWSGYQIGLGAKFLPDILNYPLDEEVPDINVYNVYQKLARSYYGLVQHEIAHILFTDFNTFVHLMELLQQKTSPQFVMMFKVISNIIEDYYIEYSLAQRKTFKTFLVPELNKTVFSAKAWKERYMADIETSDPFSQFVNFLPFYFSNPKVITFYPLLFSKLRKQLKRGFKYAYASDDGELRLRRTLALAVDLFKFFQNDNHKFDFDKIYNGYQDEDLDNDEQDLMKQPSNGANVESPYGDFGIEANDIKGKGEAEAPGELNTFLDAEDPISENRATKAEHKLTGGSGDEDDDESEATDLNFDPRNNQSRFNTSHKYEDKRSEFINASRAQTERLYEQHHSTVADIIEEIIDVIQDLKRTNYHRYESGYMQGKKIKPSKLHNPATYKIMQRKIPKRKQADLTFTFMIDISASMGYQKRREAIRAYIAFQEACHFLDIPTSAYFFVANNMTRTFLIKDFTDEYEDVKDFICNMHLDTAVSRTQEFNGGNIDEDNITIVGNSVLNLFPRKDNVMIVLSDGQTCGSVPNLTRTVKQLTKRGMEMFAVGLLSDAVKYSYPRYLIINDPSDMAQLPNFLGEYLIDSYFKN